MEEKKVKITPPEGWEIDIEKSDLSTGDIVYKETPKVTNKLPKSWNELGKIAGYYISTHSCIIYTKNESTIPTCTNLFPTKEYAEAVLALAQLLQLRERYIGIWKHNWGNNSSNFRPYIITTSCNKLEKSVYYYANRILSFPTSELRDEFYNNFQELLEIAKPLL